MVKLSITILAVWVYAMISEAFNQYTTLLGWSHGGYENDGNARYLLSISPVLETIVIFAIPIALIILLYLVWVFWKPVSPWRKRLQLTLTITLLLFTITLGIGTTYYAVSDYNTLHAYHIL